MTQRTKQHTSGCPVAFGLDIFGDRWTLLILREMMINAKKTYGDFLKIDEEIATNILADRLKMLENEGVVQKNQNPNNRRSFIYSLTDKGRDLAPVLIEIILWSGKHDISPLARKDTVAKIKKDRDGFENTLRTSTS